MYNIKIYNFEKKYLLDELIKIFLMPSQYRLLDDDEFENSMIEFNKENFQDRNLIKQEIYNKLSSLTGMKPEWGILTGIRPTKLVGEKYEELGSRELAVKYMIDYYYLNEEKANLIMDMYLYQINRCGYASDDSAGVYIGIPFCPTRCLYCSFASNQVPDEEISRYIVALNKEISEVGKRMRGTGIYPETIYIGGGTPTTLTASQLDDLINTIKESFDFSKLKEFTIEAGRPDTITSEKLKVIKKHGIDRISINPQSMKEKTLNLIGRNHKPEDIEKAFDIAIGEAFDSINADIIAGLPEESLDDFVDTLKQVIELGADNVTVHSLAVKRASKLVDLDKDFHYKQARIVRQMLDKSRAILDENGYIPYYLYRQKHMAGAFENTGYCKPKGECIYNIRIMDEHQTIIALGAGGISKAYNPKDKTLKRIPNVTNYEEYIKRIDEMLERKEKLLFGGRINVN